VKKQAPAHEEPLPATLGFVLALGIFIAVVWASMFLLLASRW
jgi:hypothetical protein